MAVGGNLRKIRTGNKLSQQEVADYIGIERKTYMNWESGASDVKSAFIPKLAELFNVEIGDLFKEKSQTK